MATTWVLVADAARARLFRAHDEQFESMQHLKTWNHAEGRLHEGDLVTGSEGAKHGGKDDSQRSTGPQVSATDHEEDVFAKALAEQMRDGRVSHDYDQLVLVAAPRFLGKLRETLDEPTRKVVSHSLDKDYSKHPAEEISELVKKALG